MNRTLLIALLVVVLALGGSIGWLMIGQQELQTQLVLKETEIAQGEATLVQLFSQKREQDEQNQAALSTAEAEIVLLQGEATAAAPVIATQAAVAGQPAPTPAPTAPIE